MLPWLYMFVIGMLLQWKRDLVAHWMQGRFATWLVAYLLWVAILDAIGVNTVGNSATPLSLLPLAGLVLSAAFTNYTLAHRWLRGHDFSYGIYLYHMPVINAIIATSPHIHKGLAMAVLVVTTCIFALTSWHIIERPALRLKFKTPNQP